MQILKTIPHWRCEYVNQTGHEAAHALAKRATKFVIDRDWVGCTPDCICDIIEKEKISRSRD